MTVKLKLVKNDYDLSILREKSQLKPLSFAGKDSSIT